MEVQNDEISLRELIEKGKEWYAYLLSQWKIILLAGIIGAALGLAYSFIKKLHNIGADAFLIGEHFMRVPSIKDELKRFKNSLN